MDDPDDYCATETPHVDCEPPLDEEEFEVPELGPNPDVSLHFYYDDPDSMRRYRECNQAADVKLALWNFINDPEDGIHNIVKWKRDPAFWEGMTGYSVLAWVEERLAEVFEVHGVDWEE